MTKKQLREESLKRKGYLPKYYERYWYTSVNLYGDLIWRSDPVDWDLYYLGRTFKTEKEAKAWLEKYGDAWFTGEE